jgi:tetratricopeptide (TPR) repeat protein
MRAVLVFLVLAIAAVPAGAGPLKPEAQKHLDAGLALFDKGEYAKAIVEFKAAYDIDPAPKILFARAQAERLGGDCDTAMDLYNKYLETLPSESQTEAARTAMKLCDGKTHPPAEVVKPPVEQDEVAKPPPETHAVPPPETAHVVPPTVVPPEVIPTTTATSPVEAHRPWYRRHPIGAGLAAGGTVSIGVGVGFLISSSSAKRRAENEMNRDDFLDAIDRANSRRKIGIGALAVGAALVTAGILEISLHHTRSEAVVAGTDGTTVYVRAAF